MTGPFLLLFVENFLSNCAFNSPSLLPPYLVSLGASQTYVGFYNTLGTLLIVIVVVFFGRPLVRLPRVRAMRWALFFLVVTSILSWVFSESLILLVVFKLFGSVAQVFSATLLLSVLFDLSPPKKRAGTLAVYSIAGMLTNPVASLAGETVLRSAGGRGLFLLAAAFSLAAWGWSLLLREPPKRLKPEEPHSFRTVVTRRDLRPLLVLAFSFGMYYSALVSFLPRHTQITLGEANLSAFLIPFSLVSIAIRLVLGNQLDRRPPRRFLYFSFLSIFAAQILLLLPPTWAWLILAGFLYGVGHSILFPLMNALFVGAGGENQKAVYSNAFLVANQLGSVSTTPLLGALGDVAGFSSIIGILALVALGSFFLVRARFPRPVTNPPSSRSS